MTAAGVLARFGLAALVATAILALARVVDAWLAALIVALVLLAVAGVAALLDQRAASEAVPPAGLGSAGLGSADVDAVRHRKH